MKFNVSQVRTYLDCPTKAHYTHTLSRVPIGRKSLALELGTCWHIAMEKYLRTRDKQAALNEVLLYLTFGEGTYDESKEVQRKWEALIPAFQAWSVSDEWEILAVEQLVEHRFSTPFELVLQGRLDGLVRYGGSYWHLQHKSLGASTPLSTYFAYIQRDWHECWYEYACRAAGYEPYGGTILNIVRKLSAKVIQEDPQRALVVQYIPRPFSIVKKAMFDLEMIGKQLMIDKDFPEAILQNRSMCAGRYGNSLCPYIDVCNGISNIDDNEHFKTAEPRYTEGEQPLAAIAD